MYLVLEWVLIHSLLLKIGTWKILFCRNVFKLEIDTDCWRNKKRCTITRIPSNAVYKEIFGANSHGSVEGLVLSHFLV